MTKREKQEKIILAACKEFTIEDLQKMDDIDITKIWAWLYFSEKLWRH